MKLRIRGNHMPDKRAELLKAATHMFAIKGYRGASTRAIARRARANESSIYRLFGSKQRLYCAVLEQQIDVVCGFLCMRQHDSPEEMLVAWMRASKADRLGMRLLYFALLEGTPDHGNLKRSLARLYAPLTEYVDRLKSQGGIAQEVPTRAAALALASLAGYPTFFAVTGGDDRLAADTAELPRHYSQIWLRGVSAQILQAARLEVGGGAKLAGPVPQKSFDQTPAPEGQKEQRCPTTD